MRDSWECGWLGRGQGVSETWRATYVPRTPCPKLELEGKRRLRVATGCQGRSQDLRIEWGQGPRAREASSDATGK